VRIFDGSAHRLHGKEMIEQESDIKYDIPWTPSPVSAFIVRRASLLNVASFVRRDNSPRT